MSGDESKRSSGRSTRSSGHSDSGAGRLPDATTDADAAAYVLNSPDPLWKDTRLSESFGVMSEKEAAILRPNNVDNKEERIFNQNFRTVNRIALAIQRCSEGDYAYLDSLDYSLYDLFEDVFADDVALEMKFMALTGLQTVEVPSNSIPKSKLVAGLLYLATVIHQPPSTANHEVSFNQSMSGNPFDWQISWSGRGSLWPPGPTYRGSAPESATFNALFHLAYYKSEWLTKESVFPNKMEQWTAKIIDYFTSCPLPSLRESGDSTANGKDDSLYAGWYFKEGSVVAHSRLLFNRDCRIERWEGFEERTDHEFQHLPTRSFPRK